MHIDNKQREQRTRYADGTIKSKAGGSQCVQQEGHAGLKQGAKRNKQDEYDIHGTQRANSVFKASGQEDPGDHVEKNVNEASVEEGIDGGGGDARHGRKKDEYAYCEDQQREEGRVAEQVQHVGVLGRQRGDV
ncbi:hypothetical protein FGB62_59g047 [Gracilaria domingensis]|nr:hypothetical protein FGB62_59g047 [Gracilaria domingensis]